MSSEGIERIESDGAEARSRLDGISVARPCPKRWAELVGDDQRRFCAECALSVTNLSALSRREAEDFLARGASGRMCVTYLQGPDGRILTREDRAPAPTPASRGGWLTHLAHVAALLLGFLPFLPGCRPVAADPTEAGAGAGRGDPSDPTRPMGSIVEPELRALGEAQVMGDVAIPATQTSQTEAPATNDGVPNDGVPQPPDCRLRPPEELPETPPDE